MSEFGQQDQLAWTASLINREMNRKTYGTVTVQLEAGRVTHVKTERSEKPPLDKKK